MRKPRGGGGGGGALEPLWTRGYSAEMVLLSVEGDACGGAAAAELSPTEEGGGWWEGCSGGARGALRKRLSTELELMLPAASSCSEAASEWGALPEWLLGLPAVLL